MCILSNHVTERAIHSRRRQHRRTKHDCVGSLVNKQYEPKTKQICADDEHVAVKSEYKFMMTLRHLPRVIG